MNWGGFFQRAGQLIVEALSAGATAAGIAYQANPHAKGEEIGVAAASAAVLYLVGRVLPQLTPHGG